MNLLELQRRMSEDVRRPLTADYGMQRTTEEGEFIESIAAGYITPNTRLTSFERLEIYNRQYWFRVIGAVSEDFPALNAMLGARHFDALVLAYLKENPSTSWTLRNLGARLPEFLQAHPELVGRRHQLAIEIAHLECAYVDAFDGKHLDPLDAKDIETLGPGSKLSLQPHLRLLALSYPVDDLVLSVRKGIPESEIVSSVAFERGSQPQLKLPSMRRGKAIYLAVHRFDESVYYKRIEREEFLLLKALRSGACISTALQQAFSSTRLTAERQAALVQECFAHASSLGWLCPLLETEEGFELMM